MGLAYLLFCKKWRLKMTSEEKNEAKRVLELCASELDLELIFSETENEACLYKFNGEKSLGGNEYSLKEMFVAIVDSLISIAKDNVYPNDDGTVYLVEATNEYYSYGSRSIIGIYESRLLGQLAAMKHYDEVMVADVPNNLRSVRDNAYALVTQLRLNEV
jgi:hypothetical protein